jgi:hypothetical protein
MEKLGDSSLIPSNIAGSAKLQLKKVEIARDADLWNAVILAGNIG